MNRQKAEVGSKIISKQLSEYAETPASSAIEAISINPSNANNSKKQKSFKRKPKKKLKPWITKGYSPAPYKAVGSS